MFYTVLPEWVCGMCYNEGRGLVMRQRDDYGIWWCGICDTDYAYLTGTS